MPPQSELERDLQNLATELRRLEAEYTMYFGGRLPRPPHETRGRVEALLKRLDRAAFEQIAQKFRFQTLQSRFSTFVELWDRNMRLKEEGRTPRGGARPAPASPAAEPRDRVVHDSSFPKSGPTPDRVQQLYAAVAAARRESGEPAVSFQRFEEIVRGQVAEFQQQGAGEVTFRVAIRDGKVRLTARAAKAEK